MQTDDFQDGTLEGWQGAFNRVTNEAGGAGGAGDLFLNVTSRGGGGNGSRLAVRTDQPQWTGDYSAIGVEGLAMDIMNTTSSPSLEMRVTLFEPARTTRWTSTLAVNVANDGAWHPFEFLISEADFTRVRGGLSFDSVYTNVGRLLIRHDAGTPSAQGTPVVAEVGFDNFRFLVVSSVDPDFDDDTDLDGDDLDALVAEIASLSNDSDFDLTGDGAVNEADLQDWLAQAGAENLPSGNAYLPSDANLDGLVDVSDFNRWNAHKSTATAAWTRGDFNADGQVNDADFVIWEANRFMASAAGAVVVPEPSGGLFAGWCLLMLAARKHARKRGV